jgi:prepilin-type N-terminal cleavage/methylation domain-containing protein
MHRSPSKVGYTLIELVIVIMLLAILAAVAIPNFIDFRADGKNAATNAALGAFRAAIVIATASIALREDASTLPTKYPSLSEMWSNVFLSTSPNSHPILAASNTNIMDAAAGIPRNPWSLSTLPQATFNSIYDCSALTGRGVILATPSDNRGWCYKGSTSGVFWANSQKNGSTTDESNY